MQNKDKEWNFLNTIKKMNIAYSEVLEVLKGIKQCDIEKIPKKLIKQFEENCDKEYICSFDHKKPLKEIKLSDEAVAILDIICYNYWCKNEYEKKLLLKQLNENEIEFQDKLKQIYNTDNLFKKKEQNENLKQDEMEANVYIIKYKETFFNKIIKKIKGFFKK